jgi:hypothetical protein
LNTKFKCKTLVANFNVESNSWSTWIGSSKSGSNECPDRSETVTQISSVFLRKKSSSHTSTNTSFPCFCVFKTIESVGSYRSWFQSNFYVHRWREGKKPKSHYVMLHPYQLDALHNTNCRVIKRWTDKVKLCNQINTDTKKISDFLTKKDFESGTFLWVGQIRANKHILFYGLR